MRKIENPYNESMFTFTTPSEMEIIVVHKPEFVNQSAVIGTSFGGLTTSIINNGENIALQPGLAHFLEHQLFESDLGNIMGDFTKLGANVNAFTSYHETAYYFSTTNHMLEPLSLLLDMVNDVSITEKSTKKEKGIILQELSMYDQMPEAMLLKKTFESLYINHPMKHDIGGSKESVSDISFQDLNEAYNMFYHPSNLCLVVVTHHDVDDVQQWILNHPISNKQALKQNIEFVSQSDSFDHLPCFASIEMDVTQNKITVAIPVLTTGKKMVDHLKQQWAIKVILEEHFSEINPDYQQWMDDGIINELFDYDVDIESDYGHVLFLFENMEPNQAKEFVMSQIARMTPTMATLEQIKRRYFFSSLRVFNRPTSIMTQLMHYHLKKASYFDVLETIDSLTLDDLNDAKNQLIGLTSVVEIKKKSNLD